MLLTLEHTTRTKTPDNVLVATTMMSRIQAEGLLSQESKLEALQNHHTLATIPQRHSTVQVTMTRGLMLKSLCRQRPFLLILVPNNLEQERTWLSHRAFLIDLGLYQEAREGQHILPER